MRKKRGIEEGKGDGEKREKERVRKKKRVKRKGETDSWKRKRGEKGGIRERKIGKERDGRRGRRRE